MYTNGRGLTPAACAFRVRLHGDWAGTHGWTLERGLSCPLELIKEVKSTAEVTHPFVLSTDAYHKVTYVSGDGGQALVGCSIWADAFGMATLATEVNTPVTHLNA